jgi:hypothetical protein
MKTLCLCLLVAALPLRAGVSVSAVTAGNYLAVETTTAAGVTTVTVCSQGGILVVDGFKVKALPLSQALALAKSNGVL